MKIEVGSLLSCPLTNDDEGRPKKGIGKVGYVACLYQYQGMELRRTGRVLSYWCT